MPAGKRLSKRQARELEELDSLKQSAVAVAAAAGSTTANAHATKTSDQLVSRVEEEEEEEVEEDDQEKKGAIGAPKSAFAALSLAEDEQVEEDEGNSENDSADDQGSDTKEIANAPKGNKKKKKKKKKKKATSEAQAEGAEPATSASTDASKPKLNVKAKNAVQKSGGKVDDMSLDELDQLLAQQTSSAPGATSSNASAAATATQPTMKLRSLLSCTTQNFDPMVELKRNFGAAAVRAYEAEAKSSGGGAAGGRAARMRNAAYNPNLRLRCTLVQPKPEWPPINQTFTGLGMDDAIVEGKGRVCNWIHSRAYKEAQYNFLDAVRSYDPNSLYALYRVYPWHLDTLLQLSEVLRHQGDLGQAGDFVARALFALERCASPGFLSSLTSATGPAYIDFKRVENRAFYLAAHRHINYLGRRGTWRTSLEWCKLLLAASAPADHHAIILWIDFLAIKSNQHQWLLQLDEAFEGIGGLDWSVGWQFAKALAARAAEREAKAESHATSDAVLEEAIKFYPEAVPILLKKVGVDLPQGALDEALRTPVSYAECTRREAHIYLLSHLYAARSESLWKEHDHGKWLAATFERIWPTIRNEEPIASEPNVETLAGIYRHVIISDIPDSLRQQLISFIPSALTSRAGTMDASDPFSPVGGTVYDDQYFSDVSGRLGRNSSAGDDFERLQRMLLEVEQRMPEEEREGFFARMMQQLNLGAQNAGEDGEQGNEENQGGPAANAAAEDTAGGLVQRMMNFLRARAPEQ